MEKWKKARKSSFFEKISEIFRFFLTINSSSLYKLSHEEIIVPRNPLFQNLLLITNKEL